MCVYYVKSVNMYYFMCLYMCTMLRVLIMSRSLLFHVFIYYVYYVKSVNMSRSLLFHVFICVCVLCFKSVNMSRSLLFHVFMCTMLGVLICQGVYYFMCLYMCVLC